MYEKIIWQVRDALRVSTPYSEEDLLVFTLQLLAWTKLSFNNSIELDFHIQNMRSVDTLGLKSIFDELAKKEGIVGQAYTGLKTTANSEISGLQKAIELCIKLGEAGMLDTFHPTDAINLINFKYLGEINIPPEIADLMIGLISNQPNSIYTPWDFGAQLAGRALKTNIDVYLEVPKQTSLPALIGLLLGGNINIKYSDPISSPQFIESGKLQQFDVSVAIPPVGIRYEVDVIDRDWFGRFPERTNSGSVLTVRHLLAQTKERVVIAAPNTLLSSPGYEKTLREDLIHKGMVEAVISMPSGLSPFSNITNIAMSILVLDPRGGHKQIRFVNADNECFREPTSKAKARLVQVDQLIALAKGQLDNDNVVTTPTEEVIQNDHQLLVSRYILADSSKRIQTILASKNTITLGDLVSTIRPMPTIQDSHSYIEAQEVGAADLTKFGYIKTTGRKVKIDSDIAQKNKHQFLKPLDIVLIVKGSVGKVGIVPADLPTQGNGGWVAGQSATILRVNDPSKINPRALAIYLRSELGQELLKSIVSGATIQLIQLRELLRLQIIIPTYEEQLAIANALDEEATIQEVIEAQINKQSKISANFWKLD